MDYSTFDILYDKACESAILESYRRIQIPEPTVIKASWCIVLQRLEKITPYTMSEEETTSERTQ
jgi:hypothetical protein